MDKVVAGRNVDVVAGLDLVLKPRTRCGTTAILIGSAPEHQKRPSPALRNLMLSLKHNFTFSTRR